MQKTVFDLSAENRELRRQLEELARKSGNKPQACNFCRYFVRHYVLTDRGFSQTYQGHCVHGRRIKHRKESDYCGCFEAGEGD